MKKQKKTMKDVGVNDDGKLKEAERKASKPAKHIFDLNGAQRVPRKALQMAPNVCRTWQRNGAQRV